MGPDPRPESYRFDMTDDALAGVAAASVAYFSVRETGRVATADQTAEYMLSDDPVRNGTLESEGLWRLVVSPLTFLYEVYPATHLVRVTAVRYFPV